VVSFHSSGAIFWLASIEEHNRQRKPFIWKAPASDILEKVKRAKFNLNTSPSV
jgi:hypothetical protein